MTAALRRLNLSPRALVLAGAAVVVFLIWRRGGGGGGGGSGISGPLTTDPLGGAAGADGLTQVDNLPQVIPLPPTGGIVHIPGEDPIVIQPAPTPTPTPVPQPSGAPRYLMFFGRQWRAGQGQAFYTTWKRQHRGKDTAAAWRLFLRQHPRAARFFGFPVPAAAAASTKAAAPNAQPDATQAAAAGSPPNTPRAMAAVPKPRAAVDVPGRQVVSTISGAVVEMPPYALRGLRAPDWRDTELLHMPGSRDFPGRGIGWRRRGAFPGRGLGLALYFGRRDELPSRRDRPVVLRG